MTNFGGVSQGIKRFGQRTGEDARASIVLIDRSSKLPQRQAGFGAEICWGELFG